MNFLEMNDEMLQSIFGQIITWWCSKVFDPANIGDQLADCLQQTASKIVSSAIEIYSNVRSGLLPTPAKMHYTYNLRDLGKLFQGILMIQPQALTHAIIEKSQPAEIVGIDVAKKNFVDLFNHENLRVFSDRLVDETD